jgi:hypothetical protein
MWVAFRLEPGKDPVALATSQWRDQALRRGMEESGRRFGDYRGILLSETEPDLRQLRREGALGCLEVAKTLFRPFAEDVHKVMVLLHHRWAGETSVAEVLRTVEQLAHRAEKELVDDPEASCTEAETGGIRLVLGKTGPNEPSFHLSYVGVEIDRYGPRSGNYLGDRRRKELP